MSGLGVGRSLRQNEYHAITLPEKDPKNQGRYKVHIPELHPLIQQGKGIWVKNHIHRWRYNGCDDYFYGEYKPLQPGTIIMVKFYEDDLNTGYVHRIVSDQILNCLLKMGADRDPSQITNDRDDMYLIYKTPKKHNMFLVLEDTKGPGLTANLIPNSIHFYFNELRSTMIINEDGIHWYSDDNRGVTIKKNNSELVYKEERIQIKKDRHIYVEGETYRYDGKNTHFMSALTSFTSAGVNHHTVAGGRIAEDAPTIWMNSGKTVKPTMAKTNKGEDHIVRQNKIKQKLKPEKKDKADLELK